MNTLATIAIAAKHVYNMNMFLILHAKASKTTWRCDASWIDYVMATFAAT
jgi:hypothetical protein